MADAIKINSVMSDLDVTVAGKYIHILPGNKRITFPDPGEMQWIEAEEFMQDFEASRSNREAMEKWLSADDFKKLAESKLTMYQLNQLSVLVRKHYEAVFGDEGNATGSTES